MFIYRFSRLIKSKLLWGLLALLMVFAFVVADSCSGTAGGRPIAGKLGETAVDGKTLEDANQTLNILNGEGAMFLPQAAQIMNALALDGQPLPDDWASRQRAVWKLVAARELGARHGLAVGRAAGEKMIESLFVNPSTGAFSPSFYRTFLAQNNYSNATLFEETYANAWLPAQTATLAVFQSLGWVSPMEQDFTLSAYYDATTVYAATLPNTLKPEAVEVPEADRKAWYDAHPDAYRLPEQRVVAYVEIPASAFADKIVVEEMDAMQYYDDHSEEFRGTGTNATVTLPFEEVKDKAIAKVKSQRALEEALLFANETLVPRAGAEGLEAAAKDYGKPKTATLRQDRPFGFQNARDLIASAFEMDPQETPLNAVAGTDRVYLFRLDKIVAEHVAPYDEVKDRVLADARRDRTAAKLRTNGETIRGLLQAALAKGTAFDQAVAACDVDGLTATTAMTFTLSAANADLDIPHRNEILRAVADLGEKAVSEPILTPANEIVLVYVQGRTPGDALAKATAKQNLATNLARNAAFRMTADWMNWNLDREPPMPATGDVPILEQGAAGELPE